MGAPRQLLLREFVKVISDAYRRKNSGTAAKVRLNNAFVFTDRAGIGEKLPPVPRPPVDLALPKGASGVLDPKMTVEDRHLRSVPVDKCLDVGLDVAWF